MEKDRQHTRHATELQVRFTSASEFVIEYAENLSAGGLFVRQAHGLAPLSEVQVQIALPGFGQYTVKARVAHVMDEETATRYKRHPGAGLQLTETPEGFQIALTAYLHRLGRRRDSLVLVEEAACLSMLSSAGFRTKAASLDEIAEQALSSGLLAIVVAKRSARKYRDAIASAPRKVSVIGCDHAADEELLLIELDRLLASQQA